MCMSPLCHSHHKPCACAAFITSSLISQLIHAPQGSLSSSFAMSCCHLTALSSTSTFFAIKGEKTGAEALHSRQLEVPNASISRVINILGNVSQFKVTLINRIFVLHELSRRCQLWKPTLRVTQQWVCFKLQSNWVRVAEEPWGSVSSDTLKLLWWEALRCKNTGLACRCKLTLSAAEPGELGRGKAKTSAFLQPLTQV